MRNKYCHNTITMSLALFTYVCGGGGGGWDGEVISWSHHHWLSLGLSDDHDDVIKRKHFPRNWPIVWGIHRSPVNSPHKGQWRGALMFSLIYVWINDWVNNRKADDFRRYCAHYDVIVMLCPEQATPIYLSQRWPSEPTLISIARF